LYLLLDGFEYQIAIFDKPMMKLPSRIEAAFGARLSNLLVLSSFLGEAVQSQLYWAFYAFTEFSALVLSKTFWNHLYP
jgi:hypothetical protein